MGKRNNFFQILLLCGILLICGTHLSSGQEKFNISAGIGSPELLNVGLRLQHNQTQFGLTIGSLPLKDENIISFSGDVYYHFAGSSALSDRKPWYARTGLGYLRHETNTFIDKYVYLNLRMGRDFHISEKFGVNMDVGVSFELHNDKTQKEPSNGLRLEFPVLPSLGIAIFYRI
ncbi:MAG: hypothetical protein EA361_00940 [Bacteroidetes bacterium]|nr:MAG: hypothetical protein EA361_00940 [Bacteroidota bacterium]